MEEQAKLWNGPAGRAWVDAQASLDRMFMPFEELLIERIDGRGGRILDVGCGTGSTTLAAARLPGVTGAVGIDISEPMIAAARARATLAQVPATFVCANAELHAFPPATFDTIISRFGVMFFDDPVAAFSNLRRASATGAQLHAIAWRSVQENAFMTTAERAARPFMPELPARRPDAPGQFAFASAERVRPILEKSGWTAIEIRQIDVECTLPEQELEGYLTRLGPVGLVLQSADDRTRARVIATVRAAFEPFVHGAEVRFTAACWMIDARR